MISVYKWCYGKKNVQKSFSSLNMNQNAASIKILQIKAIDVIRERIALYIHLLFLIDRVLLEMKTF